MAGVPLAFVPVGAAVDAEPYSLAALLALVDWLGVLLTGCQDSTLEPEKTT